jgi:hypothetical protein
MLGRSHGGRDHDTFGGQKSIQRRPRAQAHKDTSSGTQRLSRAKSVRGTLLLLAPSPLRFYFVKKTNEKL